MRFHSATLTGVNPFPFRSLLRYCPSFAIQILQLSSFVYSDTVLRFHSTTLTGANPFPFRSLLRYCPSFVIQLRFPLSCLSFQLSSAYVCVAVHQNSALHSIMSPYTKIQLYSPAMPSAFMLCISGCCRT